MNWLRKLLRRDHTDDTNAARMQRALETDLSRELQHAERVAEQRRRVIAAVRNTTAALSRRG